MPKPWSGGLEKRRTADGKLAHYLRVRMPDGSRPRILLGVGLSDKRAEAKAEAWYERRDEMTAAYLAAKASAAASRVVTDDAAPVTVRKLGEEWTSGALLKRYGRVYGLKEKKDAANDEDRMRRCCAVRTRGDKGPVFGDIPIADVTEDDVTRVLAAAPRSPATARAATVDKYYAVLHRLFELAERPCRLRPRSSNPVDRGLRPAKDEGKIFSYLYPNELRAVLAHPTVPVARKVFYVLACYVGLRKGSILALRWRDVDLEHGAITALVVKNGEPQTIPLYFDGLRWTLERWYEASGKPDGDALVLGDLGCRSGRVAGQLRADLRAAGVTRAVLFVDDDPKIEPLRAHDMRATFVTWARRAGMSEGWIVDRSGHLDAKMVARYARAARALADLQIEPFPELTRAIPELVLAHDWPIARSDSPPEALCAVTDSSMDLPEVHEEGLEPSRLSAPEPKSRKAHTRRRFRAQSQRARDFRRRLSTRLGQSLAQRRSLPIAFARLVSVWRPEVAASLFAFAT